MNKSKKIISFAILLLLAAFQLSFVFNINRVLAGPLWDNQTGMGVDSGNIGFAFGGNEPEDIRVIVANYIEVFLGFMGIVLLVLLVIAGFKYMTAQGDSKKTEDALAQIKMAIIGLIIILASFGIAVLVIDSLNTATNG